MSVYKDEQRGTWYCMFRYNDWTGRQKQKCKRGFKTKREAKEYEEQFMQTTEADMNMKVGAFVEIYFRYFYLQSKLLSCLFALRQGIFWGRYR